MRSRAAFERAARAAALALVLAAPARADTLAEVQRAAESGEYARGLALARAEPDPMAALTAEVWLWYRARDFVRAFEGAERGLELYPGTLWFAERACAAALWMRDPVRATQALASFQEHWAPADPAERARYEPALAAAREQTLAMSTSAQRAQSARGVARGTALAMLAGVIAALLALGMGLRRGEQSVEKGP